MRHVLQNGQATADRGYSMIVTSGEVGISLPNGRPGFFSHSEEAREFHTAVITLEKSFPSIPRCIIAAHVADITGL